MAEESGGGFAFPESVLMRTARWNGSAKKHREKISERNNWLCFMGKFQFVFLLMSNKLRQSDPTRSE